MKILRYMLLFVGFGIASSAWAHGGKLDTNGCHNDTKTHQYHCHKGPHAGQTFSSKEAMLKGEAGGPLASNSKKATEQTEKAHTATTLNKKPKTAKAETSTDKKADAASTDGKAKHKHKKSKKEKTDKAQSTTTQ